MSYSHNHIGEDLLIHIKKGDELAFTAFCDQYHSFLFVKANQRLQNEEESKDVVQEICIWIWEHRETIDVSKGVQAWLMGAVRNKTAELVRQKIARRRRERRYADQQKTLQMSSFIEIKELGTQLHNAINAISPATRQAFILAYLEDKSLKEVAAEMGINVQSVKNHIHRALKLLRKKLEKK